MNSDISRSDYEWNEGYAVAALSKGTVAIPQGAHKDFIAGYNAAIREIQHDIDNGGDGYI